MEEWQRAPEVDVVTAGDGLTTMRQNVAGTLLTEPMKDGRRPQTIVPVGNLISLLGYELLWTKRRCVLRAPDGREEVLKMTSGCPEVNEALALELIAKIEQEKLAQLEQSMEDSKAALVRAMAVQQDAQWEKCLRRYVDHGKFEEGRPCEDCFRPSKFAKGGLGPDDRAGLQPKDEKADDAQGLGCSVFQWTPESDR